MKRLCIALALVVAACQQSPEALRAYYEAEGDRLEEATKNVRLAYTFEDFIAGRGAAGVCSPEFPGGNPA